MHVFLSKMSDFSLIYLLNHHMGYQYVSSAQSRKGTQALANVSPH